jgi:hypothetical protein
MVVRMRVVIRWQGSVWRFGAAACLWTGLCAAALAYWIRRDEPVPRPDPLATMTVEAPDLVLKEAVISGEGEHRKVIGVLVNRSERTYANVAVTFTLARGPNNVGLVSASISRIGSHATVRFETEEFAQPRVQAILRDVTPGLSR